MQKGQLLVCSNCKRTYYCNKTCQKLAWPEHKIHCKELNKKPEQALLIKKSLKIIGDNIELMKFMSILAYHNSLLMSIDQPYIVECQIITFNDNNAEYSLEVSMIDVNPEIEPKYQPDHINIALRCTFLSGTLSSTCAMAMMPKNIVVLSHEILSSSSEFDLDKYVWPALIIVKNGEMNVVTK
jgi:hypothetical protein